MLRKNLLIPFIARRALVCLVAALLSFSATSALGQSLSEARELVEERRFQAAAVALTAFLIDAESAGTAELAQAYSLLGESQRQRNRFAEAAAAFRRAYELDPSLGTAAFGVGLAERYGWDSAPNPVRARELLRQAVDADVADAALELGLSYLSAPPVDEQRGLAALQEGAGLGQREATFILGELHRVGQFVRADPQEAFRWYLQAAELGHAAAMFQVAMAYRDGNTVAADPAAAATWLQRSIDSGNSEALHFAGFEYESRGDMVQANQYYWRAAQAGLMRAQINLGVSFMMGNRGVRQDFSKAYYWFNRAAGAGLADYYRGRLLEHGRGVESDLAAAYTAYEAAAQTALSDAVAHVALFLDLGRGVQANPERAATYFAELAASESVADLNSAAWVLATHPAATAAHAQLALEMASRAATMTSDPSVLDTLAAAHAASGDFTQAISVQEQAMRATDDAATIADFESRLAQYRAGQRWIDDVVAVAPATTAAYPEESVVFTGEVVALVQAAPDNAVTNVELEPGNSDWGVMVRVGRMEQGELPQHLQNLAVFYLHSPLELFARLPGTVSIMSPPQGEYRFTLTMMDLDFDLAMSEL